MFSTAASEVSGKSPTGGNVSWLVIVSSLHQDIEENIGPLVVNEIFAICQEGGQRLHLLHQHNKLEPNNYCLPSWMDFPAEVTSKLFFFLSLCVCIFIFLSKSLVSLITNFFSQPLWLQPVWFWFGAMQVAHIYLQLRRLKKLNDIGKNSISLLRG